MPVPAKRSTTERSLENEVDPAGEHVQADPVQVQLLEAELHSQAHRARYPRLRSEHRERSMDA